MPVWWEQLAARERRMISLAAAVLAAAFLYLGVLEPIVERRAAAANQLQQLVDEYTWMLAQAPAVGAMAATVTPAAQGAAVQSPLAIVDQSARSVGLGAALRRVRPQENGVEVELESAVYSTLMRWLATLETQYGLRIESLNLDPGPEPGRVNAQLRIEPTTGGR